MRSKKIILWLMPMLILFLAQCSYDAKTQGEVRASIDVILEDDFSENEILITLQKEDPTNFREWTVEDFRDVNGVIYVKELTADMTRVVQNQVEGNWEALEEHLSVGMLMDIDNYHRIFCIRLSPEVSSKENIISAIKQLQLRNEFFHVSPNFIFSKPLAVPNDPYYHSTHASGLSHQWGLQKIDAETAWQITTGSANVKAGILDSGLSGNH